MSLVYEIARFFGLDEIGNKFKQEPGYCARIENWRPEGQSLDKMPGNQLHSVLNYRMADRPVTLIRFATESGTKYFIATAWDNILKYDSTWQPLLVERDLNEFNPGNLLYYVNEQFDWIIYAGVLYLTDGANTPMKYDGAKVGTWGYKQIAENSDPTVLPIGGEIQAAAGNLLADTYNYYASLYNSTDVEEGNVGTNDLEFVLGGSFNIWLFINPDTDELHEDGNYDTENEFADKIRIYRTPSTGGAAPPAGGYVRRLVTTLDKGLVTKAGTISIDGGSVTGAGTSFLTDGVAVGDCLYDRSVVATFQISAVNAEDDMDVIDSDGSAYSGGVRNGHSYYITRGFIDSVNDRSGDDIYFGDDTTLALPQRDHSPPPVMKFCVVFGDRSNRAFGAGNSTYPNRLYYSLDGYPDYFPADNYIDIDPDDSDEITGLVKFRGKLIIFKRNSVAIANVDGDEYTWTFTPKFLHIGTHNIRQVAVCSQYLVWANHAGVWLWDGGSAPKHISHMENGSNIAEIWKNVVIKELQRAQAVYHPDRNEVWLSMCFEDSRGLYDNTKSGYGDAGDDQTPAGP